MALKTLKGIGEIGGYKVLENEQALIKEEWDKIPEEDKFIVINHGRNSISFRIQNKPIKEAGVNGCQVDTLIETAKIMIEKLNESFHCSENEVAIVYLEEALLALSDRKRNRISRGVEGTSSK